MSEDTHLLFWKRVSCYWRVTGYFRHSLKEKYQKNLSLEVSMSLTNPLEKESRTASLWSFALSLSLCIHSSIYSRKKVLNTCASQGKFISSSNENPKQDLFWDVTTLNSRICYSMLIWITWIAGMSLSIVCSLESISRCNDSMIWKKKKKIKNWAMNYLLGTEILSVGKEMMESHVIHSCNQSCHNQYLRFSLSIQRWSFPWLVQPRVIYWLFWKQYNSKPRKLRFYFPTIFVFAMCMEGLTAAYTNTGISIWLVKDPATIPQAA